MRSHWLVGFTVAACIGMGSGCVQDRTLVAADPGLVAAIALTGMDPQAPLSRAQKPDDANPAGGGVRPLDVAPERSSEVAGVPAVARIRVTVNGEAILHEEIRAACYSELRKAEQLPIGERQKRQAEIYLAAQNALIEREVVLQDAFTKLKSNKNGEKFLEKLKEAARKEWEKTTLKQIKDANPKFKTEEDIRVEFRREGASLDLMRRQSERNFMMIEYLRNRVWTDLEKIGNVQVEEYYDGHPEEYDVEDSVEWQDILIAKSSHETPEAARRFAEVVMAQARGGEDFVKLAKHWDNGVSRDNPEARGDGKLRSEIRPVEVADELFRLKEGEIGLVETFNGFHVVRVAKRINKGKRPFDAALQKEIKERLKNQTAQKEFKRIIDDLKRKAIIEYSRVTD
jgi:peptidyl-prolyl cis-trans isomerase SurA